MSDTKRKDSSPGEEVLAFFSRGAEFTRELLQENERLRLEMVRFQSEQVSAAQNPTEWEKLRVELIERINVGYLDRLATVSESLERINTTLRTEGYTLPPLASARETDALASR